MQRLIDRNGLDRWNLAGDEIFSEYPSRLSMFYLRADATFLSNFRVYYSPSVRICFPSRCYVPVTVFHLTHTYSNHSRSNFNRPKLPSRWNLAEDEISV